MARRTWWIAFAIILLLALALRLQKLRGISLTNDEVAEVTWSSMPFGAMLDRVGVDMVHPPLDYIVQYTMGQIGAPEWVRRVPPVLFGLGTIALTIVLGTLWYSELAGLIAGFLLAIAPLHVRFSQEIRPYSMALFFTVAAVVALEVYARDKRIVWGVLWFFAVFLAAFTFYFAGMTAGVVSLGRIYMDRKDRLKNVWDRLPLLFLGWAVLYAFWVPIALHAAHSPVGPPDVLDWPWWSHRLNAFGAGDLDDVQITIGSLVFWIAAAGGVLLSRQRPLLRMAVLWLGGCGFIEIAALHYRPHYSAVRHLMPAWIGAIILAAAAIAYLFERRMTIVVGAAIVLVFASFSGMTLAEYFVSGRSDWRKVAVFVHNRMKPGETLLATNEWATRDLGYYWEQLPPIPETRHEKFRVAATPRPGPIWVVSAQCRPEPNLQRVPLVQRFPETDIAEVRYVRAGETLDMSAELCPE